MRDVIACRKSLNHVSHIDIGISLAARDRRQNQIWCFMYAVSHIYSLQLYGSICMLHARVIGHQYLDKKLSNERFSYSSSAGRSCILTSQNRSTGQSPARNHQPGRCLPFQNMTFRGYSPTRRCCGMICLARIGAEEIQYLIGIHRLQARVLFVDDRICNVQLEPL